MTDGMSAKMAGRETNPRFIKTLLNAPPEAVAQYNRMMETKHQYEDLRQKLPTWAVPQLDALYQAMGGL